jgi:16S rRNA (guanine966-N2)-methyltransferase
LAPHINGARCADLFAGSGALGIEALSRGALHCEFIEPNRASCAQIGHHLEILGATQRGTCHTLTAREFLASASQTCDIVFIDPPFSQALVTPTCELLVESRGLAESALIYIESSAAEPCPSVPNHWTLHREKISGGVAYRLFQVGT